MDEASLKSNPSSRSNERSKKNKLHHGIRQGNAAMRVVVAISFTFLGLISIFIIDSIIWDQSGVRRDGTRLTDGAFTGKTSRNPIKVVDLTWRPKLNQYQVRLKVEPPLRVFGVERQKSSAIKHTNIGIKIESATKETGLSCGKHNVQCKFRSGGEPPGHKGSQTWNDDHGLSSLHRSYVDKYKSKLLLLLETNQKALASILDSRLENHAWSIPVSMHENVGSRYDADFQLSVGVSKGFEEAWLYAFNISIYGVCPSPSSVEYLFQHEYCSSWEDPRLLEREVSGVTRDHLYAHGLIFRSLPDANTPLLGPVSWARTSFLYAMQITQVGSVSPLWCLNWSCLDCAITMLPFHQFFEEVIWRRFSETPTSDTILFLISVSITEPPVSSAC